MKRKEDENLKYQHYLSVVVDYASKDYTEIEDVISRYRVRSCFAYLCTILSVLCGGLHDYEG